MNIQRFIDNRRHGRVHPDSDIREFVSAVVAESITDAQISAWLMAACINPLTIEEAGTLTREMAASGETLDLSILPRPWIDKHSTGGVGDKTTIVLTPMLAALGFSVVKMSGRGLGLTGGTIDKLESVPGFNVDLEPEQVVRQAAEIGLALTAQTPRLAPTDKRLYTLRSETATVDSIPLIVSSILSKKIAGGSDLVIMDVKCGSGAFMKTLDDARSLAKALEDIGKAAGIDVRPVISNMEFPLGTMVGNLLEIKEAIQVLKGGTGPVRDLCVHLAALSLDPDAGREAKSKAESVLDSGSSLEMAKRWFQAQGADPAMIDDENWPTAENQVPIQANSSGWVESISAHQVAQTAFDLGAGRASGTAEIDPTAGVELLISIGSRVEQGQNIAILHSNRPISNEVVETGSAAFTIVDSATDSPALILE